MQNGPPSHSVGPGEAEDHEERERPFMIFRGVAAILLAMRLKIPKHINLGYRLAGQPPVER
jgi:hypothetical protein